jgi:hypothetical protein
MIVPTAEQVAQALAKAPAPIEDLNYRCLLCLYYGGDLDNPDHHDPTCPWRMSQEWAKRPTTPIVVSSVSNQIPYPARVRKWGEP